MVNTAKLKGMIVEHNMTQAQVAQILGLAKDTFYRKMRLGKFDTDEAYQLISILNIEDPVGVFFVPEN